MITRHNATDDLYTNFLTYLPDDLVHPELKLSPEHLEAVFGDPDHMIAMIENAVLASIILHDHTFQKNEP